MKTILRNLLFSLIAVWVLDQIIPGFSLGSNFQQIAIVAFVLLLITYIIVPLLSIIFLPINIITIGVFKWVFTAGAIFALVRLSSFVELNEWVFRGFSYSLPYFSNLPPINIRTFEFTFWHNIIVLAIGYNFNLTFLQWLTTDD